MDFKRGLTPISKGQLLLLPVEISRVRQTLQTKAEGTSGKVGGAAAMWSKSVLFNIRFGDNFFGLRQA
jgi:hypothetical protein